MEEEANEWRPMYCCAPTQLNSTNKFSNYKNILYSIRFILSAVLDNFFRYKISVVFDF